MGQQECRSLPKNILTLNDHSTASKLTKMLSSIQLFSILSITLVVLPVHFVNAVPISAETLSQMNSDIDDSTKFIDIGQMPSKRMLPVEGILIGRRSFPTEGILMGKRDYPTEGILMGKRDYPTEGILMGKRDYPTEGILMGKRNFPTEGILLGKRNFRSFSPKSIFYGGFKY
ncbi:unnamed protein product [Rotaria magnacalcarata]|uniref:Uncharacterized protein n=1 Tax=Rotaria magnacalcarata TaxID=392030 RepID=A0A816Y027_9BILA|nr:unnamed protein product [Rotaria magnacalcarata]CAF1504469.1 unnamed protein product [Rotaria magnacalcarata]CAF2152853.1 unnamed protein product [Rotaria magnacalcarata]